MRSLGTFGLLLATAFTVSGAPAALAVSQTFPELERVLQQRYELCSQVDGIALPTGYAVGPTRIFTSSGGDSARSASPAD